jgi:hypothetical protein
VNKRLANAVGDNQRKRQNSAIWRRNSIAHRGAGDKTAALAYSGSLASLAQKTSLSLARRSRLSSARHAYQAAAACKAITMAKARKWRNGGEVT